MNPPTQPTAGVPPEPTPAPATGRTDVTFPSGDDTCAAWLYLPAGASGAGGVSDAAGTEGPAHPVVVMGHGLGAVKEMRLDAYAERFRAAGYACVVFDYRHFGASGGEPRQLVDIADQEEDWRAALAFARSHPRLDPDRVAIWGTSFGGGHVITTAARDHGVAAAVAQCPFTDGPASAAGGDPASMAGVADLAVADLGAAEAGRAPVTVAIVGPPGSPALMTAPDCEAGYLALTAEAPAFRNEVAARLAFSVGMHAPGALTPDVECPILFAICEHDSVAPAGVALSHAARAPRGEVVAYPVGHFDVYVGDPFEQAVADQIAFLHRHVPAG